MVSRRRRADVYATTRRRRDARRELLALVSIASTQVVVVDREDAKDIDARFLYRAVPVGTLATNPTLASSFNLSPKAKTKKRKALEAEMDANPGRAPFLGLDPNKKYWALPGAAFAKDAVGRTTITYGPL